VGSIYAGTIEGVQSSDTPKMTVAEIEGVQSSDTPKMTVAEI
jgi:hypothetical protein